MMTNGTYRAWRESAATLDAMGGWDLERVAIAGQGGAARITIADVTPSIFPMLQAVPALGRTFAAGDDGPGHPPIIILSYGFWQQQFGGRNDIVGQSVRLDAT